jgi:hypothetical protein
MLSFERAFFKIWNLELDDYRVRIEEDDLVLSLEPLSKDFTHFEKIWVMITELEWRKMMCTLD